MNVREAKQLKRALQDIEALTQRVTDLEGIVDGLRRRKRKPSVRTKAQTEAGKE